MKSIILLGYMCAGKTTVGRAVAKKLDCTFYDLDWYIEERQHRTVAQLFAEKGEEGFRRIERNVLHEVAEFEDVIISSGGGTPCFFDNIDYMNSQGTTFYLKATPDVLYKHLKMGKSVRPLLLNKTPDEVRTFIEAQLAQREPFYNKAKYAIDVNLMDTYDKIKLSVDKIKNKIEEEKGNNIKKEQE